MSRGRVLFVGCGPGAADLLTLRAIRAIAEADVVVWGRSLLEEEAVIEHARPDAEIVAWPPATQRDVLAVYDRARAEDLVVVRLKAGDPTLFGAMEPELSAARERGLACEIVPGVSAVSAAAAALGCEVACPGSPLLLVAAGEIAPGSPEPPGVAVFMAGRDPEGLERGLRARGLPRTTPCAIAAGVSRPGEILATCPLDDLAEDVASLARGGHTIVLAGPRLAGAETSGIRH